MHVEPDISSRERGTATTSKIGGAPLGARDDLLSEWDDLRPDPDRLTGK
ncbi:MAG: hypothetical protein RL417_531 [Pseudomonadota bacterium]|jgi:hypothetical protein